MSAPICVRVTERTRRLIAASKGTANLSEWIRVAIRERLERNQGIPSDLPGTLREHNAQLRALGINLNQLARSANEGRPVQVNDRLLEDIDARIRDARALLLALGRTLPN